MNAHSDSTKSNTTKDSSCCEPVCCSDTAAETTQATATAAAADPTRMSADQLRPFSRGRVLLRSGSPSDAPSAQFNYLSDRRDLLELVGGVKKMREIFSQKAFDEFRGAPILPGPDIRSDEEIEAFVRATANTDYHPCGTCRMGGDADSVVDEELRLRGVERLRVVDASVMPDVVSGNLNAPTQMIAARAADFILGRSQLRPFRPAYHFDD